MNDATIALWHRRSLLSRADIFGPADPRPAPTSPAAQRQVDVAVPGMQGKDYAPGGVMLLTVNPAGGKDDYSPSAADIALYGAYQGRYAHARDDRPTLAGRRIMLSEDLDRHVSLHHALGFKFRTQSSLLRSFVAYAEAHGDQIIGAERVLAWAVEAPSPQQRRNRLLQARRFAIAMHAEVSRHEVPAADVLGSDRFHRRIPYIYSQDDIRRLMAAAASLPPAGTIRPLTYATLFGLLAATGMRISEALALRLP